MGPEFCGKNCISSCDQKRYEQALNITTTNLSLLTGYTTTLQRM